MIEPGIATLPTVQKGGTYELIIQLFTDEAHTIPFNLTGYTVRLEVDQVGTNVPVKVVNAEGKVELTLSKITTSAMGALGNAASFVLWLEQKEGAEGWPVLKGEIPVVTP